MAGARATIGELAGPLHATLVAHGAGIWAFRWTPLPSTTRFRFVTSATPAVPAWTDAGPSGRAVLRGPASRWHVAATDRAGYVVRGAVGLVPPGRYAPVVRLSCTGPVDVEVWDTTTHTRLGRSVVAPTAGVARVTGPAVVLGHVSTMATFHGVGPFTVSPIPGGYGDQLKVPRVDARAQCGERLLGPADRRAPILIRGGASPPGGQDGARSGPTDGPACAGATVRPDAGGYAALT